jgi:peroxiredoxin
MTTHRRKKSAQKNTPNRRQVLPLFLIGSGLIILAGLAFMLLPKSGEASDSNEQVTFPSVVPVEVNYPAPELTLSDLEGNPVSLSDYRGQVVLVNNWAIWCPPCKAEMPVLQVYYNDHKDEGFTIIGIESGEPSAEVKAFVEQYGLTFPIWPDQSSQALVAFRNSSLPSSYVIDQEGQVRYAWTGAISREMLEKYITPLMEN